MPTGENAVWIISPDGEAIDVFAPPRTTDINWQLAGAADCNNDGKLDLIWRHTLTGANACWVMDYNGVRLRTFAFPSTVDQNWQIAGPR